MDEFWTYKFINNTMRDWAIALGIILFCIVAIRLVQYVIIRRIKIVSERTKTTLDDFIIRMIQKSIMPLLYIMTFYLGSNYLLLSAKVRNILDVVVIVVITFFFLRIITSFISYIFPKPQSRGILLVIQVVIWWIGFLFLIDNLGFNITTLIAGLGIGGIAIALAAQTILGDLFSYLVILFDKPFEVGDFIVVDDKMGNIEHIGIKTTRIRSINGELLVCSNTDLTKARLHNYKKMVEKRVVLIFKVVQNTSPRQIKAIPGMIKEIIETEKETRYDRAHFTSFGDSSLDFEAVYFVLSADYNTYMDIQQRINFRLLELFEQHSISFAVPTRTIYIERTD
ncbi:MAG: mechanosensitive ion channel family protein [Flavisolibacter sp.]